MNRFSLKHLSDDVLRRELATKAKNEKEATAQLIAHIAEFDGRKLYLPAAYESMFAYCVGELGLSEDEAKKRIQVARAAREFPGILDALAENRVHLSGLRLLVPHLTAETTDDLLALATHKSRDEIERLVAERFPKLDVPAQVTPVADRDLAAGAGSRSPGNVDGREMMVPCAESGAPGHPKLHARVSPLSANTYAVQFTRSREADERFHRAQNLLGHQVSRGDLAEVYDRAVKELIAKLERTRFAATSRPRRAPRAAAGSRHVPAQVRRAVWERDEGQCTYVGGSGRRCGARRGLEFDHATEFARGGEATVDNVRLRCRGHNQHTAEHTFGAAFMALKRKEAAEARVIAKVERAREREQRELESRLLPHEEELVPWLGALGIRESEARIAARRCRDMPDTPVEARMKRALSFFGARIGTKVMPIPAASA